MDVVVDDNNNNKQEQQQEEVAAPIIGTPSIWRVVGTLLKDDIDKVLIGEATTNDHSSASSSPVTVAVYLMRETDLLSITSKTGARKVTSRTILPNIIRLQSNCQHLAAALPPFFLVQGPPETPENGEVITNDATLFKPIVLDTAGSLLASATDTLTTERWNEGGEFRSFWKARFMSDIIDTFEGRALCLARWHNIDALNKITVCSAKSVLYLTARVAHILAMAKQEEKKKKKGKSKKPKKPTKKKTVNKKRKRSEEGGEGDEDAMETEETVEEDEEEEESATTATTTTAAIDPMSIPNDDYLLSHMEPSEYAEYSAYHLTLKTKALHVWTLDMKALLEKVPSLEVHVDAFYESINHSITRIYKPEAPINETVFATFQTLMMHYCHVYDDMVSKVSSAPITAATLSARITTPLPLELIRFYGSVPPKALFRWMECAPKWVPAFARLCFYNPAAVENYYGSNSHLALFNGAAATDRKKGLPHAQFNTYITAFEAYSPTTLAMVIQYVLSDTSLGVPLERLLQLEMHPNNYTAYLQRATATSSHSSSFASATMTSRAVRRQNDHLPSIWAFGDTVRQQSPRVECDNGKWDSLVKTFSIYSIHYRPSLAATVGALNIKNTPSIAASKTGKLIKPHLYRRPRSTAFLPSPVIATIDRHQAVYFVSSRRFGNFVCNQAFQESPTSSANDNEDDVINGSGGGGGGSSPPESVTFDSITRHLSNGNINPYRSRATRNAIKNDTRVWACRLSHFTHWLTICGFLQRYNAKVLGNWIDYLRCNDAVEQSVLMSVYCHQAMKDYARQTGVILLFPMCILYQRAFAGNDGAANSAAAVNSTWLNAWNRLSQKEVGYTEASYKTLKAALDKHPRLPAICLVHAEAFQDYEMKMIREIIENHMTQLRKEEEEEDGSNAIKDEDLILRLTFSPVLGGFCAPDTGDGCMSAMLLSNKVVLSEVVEAYQAKRETSDRFGRLQRRSNVSSSSSGNPSSSPNTLAQRNGLSVSSSSSSVWNPASNYVVVNEDSMSDMHIADPIVLITRYCARLLVIRTGQTSDSPSPTTTNKLNAAAAVTTKEKDALVISQEVLDKDAISPQACSYLEKFSKEARFLTFYEIASPPPPPPPVGTTTTDDDDDIDDDNNSRPPVEPEFIKIPIGVAIQQQYIPYYRVIEDANYGTNAKAAPSAIPLNIRFMIGAKDPPIEPTRLANLLSRYPIGHFSVSALDWKDYQAYWCNFQQTSFLNKQHSVPVRAFEYGISFNPETGQFSGGSGGNKSTKNGSNAEKDPFFFGGVEGEEDGDSVQVLTPVATTPTTKQTKLKIKRRSSTTLNQSSFSVGNGENSNASFYGGGGGGVENSNMSTDDLTSSSFAVGSNNSGGGGDGRFRRTPTPVSVAFFDSENANDSLAAAATTTTTTTTATSRTNFSGLTNEIDMDE